MHKDGGASERLLYGIFGLDCKTGNFIFSVEPKLPRAAANFKGNCRRVEIFKKSLKSGVMNGQTALFPARADKLFRGALVVGAAADRALLN